MKLKVLSFLALSLAFAITIGCGSGGTSSVADGASESDVEAYERLMAADEAAMNAEPPENE